MCAQIAGYAAQNGWFQALEWLEKVRSSPCPVNMGNVPLLQNHWIQLDQALAVATAGLNEAQCIVLLQGSIPM